MSGPTLHYRLAKLDPWRRRGRHPCQRLCAFLNVYDSYAGSPIGGCSTYDVMGELFVEVEGDPAPLTLRGHITASQGDRDRLLVDDASIGTEGRDLKGALRTNRG